MTVSKFVGFSLMTLIIIVAFLVGCSDNTFTSEETTVSSTASPTVYAPLEQGLRVNYINLEPSTAYFDIEVGGPVKIAGNSGHVMKQTNQGTGEVTLFYRYSKNNSVFESYEINNPGYRILESPFVAGHSWNRFDNTETEVADFTGQGDDDDQITDTSYWGGDKGGRDFFGGGYFKDKPGLDFNTMRIVGFEDVQTLNGKQYANCLKVAWPTDPLHTSYYWYYAGVGMVKYEHGFNTINDEQNHSMGVMTDFQTVEY